MSFILDALKKSEAERQRQAGPTLLEVRVTPPRRHLPLWAVALAVLLGVNLVALLWFMLRKPEAAPVPIAAAPSVAAAPPPVIVTAPAQPAAVTPAPAAATAAAAPSGAETAANPADLQPAVPASAGATRDAQGPPSYAEVGSNMPDLRLDLHVYSPRAAERYALINMHKVHEGDVLPEGARVIAINKDGVVLSYHDQEFILGQQE
jgi:general secretion pathway protein B